MDQVNINQAPRQPGGPPPRQPSRWWPIAIFLVIIAIVIIVVVARSVARQQGASATATPSAVPTATPSAVPTATISTVAAATATTAPIAATATPVPGAATNTPATASGTTVPTNTPSSAAQPPTNPTALHVTSGSCGVHQITWTWSGAQNATSYEVVLYDPRTGATIKDVTTAGTSYTLPAGPGVSVALKVRSRNATGTAPGYTSGIAGHVPPQASNPTGMSVDVSGQTLTWFWGGARNATAYDVVLYHYNAGTAHADVSARVTQPHWAIKVTPGITYYLKVRSVGQCSPAQFFTPTVSAKAR